MNVIYLNTHDTGRYLQPYGHAVETPNLQKLAEDGILFRQAHCAAPTCSPSRACFTIGSYPHTNGMYGLGHRGFRPHTPSQHMATMFKNNGYDTVAWGMPDNHLSTGSEAVGYEREMKGGSVDDLIGYLKESHDNPFFLSASFGLTHRAGRGFGADEPPPEAERYVNVPPTLPDHPDARRDWAHFVADAKKYDDIVGQLLEAIDEAGLTEDTLIIATTDHGVPFPGLKCHLTKHGTGVYLIMRGPKGFDGGKVIDGLVSQIDIYPTLCDLLEVDKPEWLEGVSVMPLVTGKRDQIHDQIFGEVNYHATFEPMRSLRTPRYLYVRRFGPRSRPVTCNWDASPSKDLWLNDGIANRPLPEEMLFDTFYDHEEMNNLALDPTYEHILEELRLRLEDWMERTDDPLVNGTVPAPENATITALDAVEPRQALCAPKLEAEEYTRKP